MPEETIPSWEEVAHTYGKFLYTLSYRLTGNDFDAHDLTQEVLLRVRRGLATYQPGSMEGWLSRITTNTFFDMKRKEKRRPEAPLFDDAETWLDDGESVESVFDAAHFSGDVQRALNVLPDEFRVAVVLSDVMGFTYQEISDATDVPIGTVRSRIHRGRLQMKKELAG